MIILDTNVISALMREPADLVVRHWLDTQAALSIWTTSVTVLELRFGLDRMPPSQRRETLYREMTAILHDDLQGRILNFGEAEAIEAATLMAKQQARGRPSGMNDIMISGIVRTNRASFATRNIKHFVDVGVPLIDPWASDTVAPRNPH